MRPRAATAAERAARVDALSEDERARLRDRSAHLREGRRLAHAGDNEGALRELQAALALGPHDATVLCEAGLQAHRLHRLEEAAALLGEGIVLSGRPQTRAACLYNLGRVFEDQQDLVGAREVYRESLALRPNDIVRDRLASIEGSVTAEADGEWEGWDAGGHGPDVDALDRDEPFASLDAVCEAVVTDGCRPADRGPWAPPAPTPALRELAQLDLTFDDEQLQTGYLFVRGDDGWRSLGAITSTDTSDDYGRLESMESIDTVRFEDGRIVVEVGGELDEPEGEAEAYWECEREHPGDDGASRACFEEATAGLPSPPDWSATHTFVVEDGRFVPD